MALLILCVASTYFQDNGKHYKQLYGTAIGSPASVFVAETCQQTIPLWLRYVDDTFTAVHNKDEIDAYYDHLNEQNIDIQFPKEIEENENFPY